MCDLPDDDVHVRVPVPSDDESDCNQTRFSLSSDDASGSSLPSDTSSNEDNYEMLRWTPEGIAWVRSYRQRLHDCVNDPLSYGLVGKIRKHLGLSRRDLINRGFVRPTYQSCSDHSNGS